MLSVGLGLQRTINSHSYLRNILRSSVGDWGIDTSRLRLRDEDDNEQEFDPVGGKLDTSGILAWSGSKTVSVAKIFDKTGNGNHAFQTTNLNQPRIVNNGTFEVDDRGSKAMYLQEAPNLQHLNVIDNSGLDITGDITLVAKVDIDSGDGYYISKNLDSAATTQYGLYDSSASVQWYLNGASRINDSTADATSKVVIATRKSGSLSSYLDGTLKNTATFSDALITRPNIQIGCRSNSVDGISKSIGLTGFISRIIIFNRALTQQEAIYISNRV